MASDGKIKESQPATTSPPVAAAAPPRAAAAAITHDSSANSSLLARFAFVVLAALTSASFFVEPFAGAAANLGLPWPAFMLTLVLLCASFGASVGLFGSFLPRPPPAISALAAQREGIGAAAVVAWGLGPSLALLSLVEQPMGTHPLAAKLHG